MKMAENDQVLIIQNDNNSAIKAKLYLIFPGLIYAVF